MPGSKVDTERLCIPDGRSSQNARRQFALTTNGTTGSCATELSFEPLEIVAETREPDDSDDSVQQSTPTIAKVDRHWANDALNSSPTVRSAVARQHAGRFHWILTFPAREEDSSEDECDIDSRSRDGRVLQYGCNLLVETKHLGKEVYCEGRHTHVYTLLATLLEGDESRDDSSVSSRSNMAVDERVVRVVSPEPIVPRKKIQTESRSRHSLQSNPETEKKARKEKTPVFVPQRAKSTRAPTRPDFELPGEAISRRKKEQREKELKEQEEAEKQRRQFRARPLRKSASLSTFPRETAASRARRLNAAAPAESHSSPPPKAEPARTISKRASIAVMSSLSSAAPRPLAQSRSNLKDQEHSSGCSVAGGSMSSPTDSFIIKRSTVSSDEVQRQRVRGKAIYEQDNGFSERRERERRERELAAKSAREQAAERSRQASREWAEKQKRKQVVPGRRAMA